MTTGKNRFITRKIRSKKWNEWFTKEHNRKPTKEEILSFEKGFNIGWKQGKKRSKELNNNHKDSRGEQWK
jgi:hypothetical protein